MQAKVKRQVILLSFLLHILFLSFWESTIMLDISRAAPAAPTATGAPLVFDLQQQEQPREVIATPADAPTARQPQKADFLSDKNALARNQEPAPGLRLSADPFSRGDLDSHDLPLQPPVPEKEAAAARPRESPAQTEKKQADAASESGSEENAEPARTLDPEKAVAQSPFRLQLPGVPHDHTDSRVAEDGGLSFNTYNWDFAPYMLALKERIGRNIFPPLAFSRLGMIDGDTVLRFRIYPDGRLSDLELLGYSGHRTLMETSRFAVKASAPFPSLPADFPKPYLEVTAKFSYFIKNKRG
jgi:outer membrane biosynthesis protein TonB